MKAAKLIDLHIQHLVLFSPEEMVEGESCAMLYGTDEFKVNYKKQAVRLPIVGWLKCNLDRNVGRVDWAALNRDGDNWTIVFGSGNPYFPENINVLPSKNGQVRALPFAMTLAEMSEMPEKPYSICGERQHHHTVGWAKNLTPKASAIRFAPF